MSCFDDASPLSAPGGRFRNWSRQVQVRPDRRYIPQTRAHLVASVRDAEAAGRKVKAIGSAWSFENVMTAGDGERLIVTEGLNRAWLTNVGPFRLDSGQQDGTGHWHAAISRARDVSPSLFTDILPPASRDRTDLVLVEGGVKLRWLNDWLWQNERAMLTAGGSAGQSIAGLVATGSHGGDLAFGPLTELVEAIHLVGARGQEHWIERASRPLTDRRGRERVRRAFACDDIQFHRNDQLFNAVVLGLGRFGVIYALVLRVRDRYLLTETHFMSTWAGIRPRLARRDPTLFPVPRAGRPRFLQVDLIPHRSGSGNPVVVKQRTEIPVAEGATPRRAPEVPDLFGQLCTRDFPADRVREILAGAAATTAGATGAAAGLFAFLDFLAPGVGATLAAGTSIGGTVLTTELAAQAIDTIDDRTVDAITIIRRLVKHLQGAGLAWVARDILSAVVMATNFSATPTTSWSYDVMDTYTYGNQCFLVRSAEFVLPFSTRDRRALSLADDIIALASRRVDEGVMVPVLLSLRWSRRGSALLSMHRAALNCAIEVPVIQGFPGSDDLMENIHRLAARRGAIPHWGQEVRWSRGRLERTFAPQLDRWRQQLARLVDPRRPDTFSSSWTRRYRLEPDRTILLRRALEG